MQVKLRKSFTYRKQKDHFFFTIVFKNPYIYIDVFRVMERLIIRGHGLKDV